MEPLKYKKTQLNYSHLLPICKKGSACIVDNRKQQNEYKRLKHKIQSSPFQLYSLEALPKYDLLVRMANWVRENNKGVGNQNIGFIGQDYQNYCLGNAGGHSEEKILNSQGYQIPMGKSIPLENKQQAVAARPRNSLPLDIFTELPPCHGYWPNCDCRSLLDYALTKNSTVYYDGEYKGMA